MVAFLSFVDTNYTVVSSRVFFFGWLACSAFLLVSFFAFCLDRSFLWFFSFFFSRVARRFFFEIKKCKQVKVVNLDFFLSPFFFSSINSNQNVF